MSRIKVFHIHPGDLALVSEGGVSRFISNIIRHKTDDIEFYLVGVTSDPRQPLGRRIYRELGEGGYYFLPLLYTPKRHLVYEGGIPLSVRFLLELWRSLAIGLPDVPDVLHVHQFELTVPFLLPRKRCPIVVTAHGGGQTTLNELVKAERLSKSMWFRFFFKPVVKFNLQRIDKLLVVSKDAFELYKRWEAKGQDRVDFLPTSVDTKLFHPMSRKNLRRKKGLPADTKLILFVGRLDRSKGLDLLIRSFGCFKSKVPDSKLLIVGDGPERELVMRESQALGLQADVIMMGARKHEEVPEIINCADLVVLTSLWEGFPLVLLESLACGVPVVSTAVGHIKDVIHNGLTGQVVQERDPEEFSAKVAEMLQSRKPTENPCREVAMRYSSELVAHQLHATYREVFERRVATWIQ